MEVLNNAVFNQHHSTSLESRRSGGAFLEAAIAKAADADAWAAGLADEYQFEPPAVDVERATLPQNGRVNVDCTNEPLELLLTKVPQ